MASQAIDTRSYSSRANLMVGSITLQRHVRVLLVSPDTEMRQPLLRTLESVSTDVIVCSNRAQAEEVQHYVKRKRARRG